MVFNLPHDTHVINATHCENMFCMNYAPPALHFSFLHIVTLWFCICTGSHNEMQHILGSVRVGLSGIAHSNLPVYRALCHAFLWAFGSNYVALPLFTFCLSALCWPHPVIYAISMTRGVFWLSRRFTDTKESFHLNVMNQPGRMRNDEECQHVIKIKKKVQCLYSMYHTNVST